MWKSIIVGNRRWTAILLCLAAGLLIGGCSGEESIEKGAEFLWGALYVVLVIISIVLTVWVGSHNKFAGGVVAVIAIAGIVLLHHVTRYVEPSADQPHAKIEFLIESRQGSFTVRLDDVDLRLGGNMTRYHKDLFGGTADGEYTTRVTPGSHEIRVAFYHHGGYYEESTDHDLRCDIQVKAGETRYFLLCNDTSGHPLYGSSGISITEITEARYKEHRSSLKKPPDKRPRLARSSPWERDPLSSDPLGSVRDLRELMHKQVLKMAEERGPLSAKQKKLLIEGVDAILDTDLPPEEKGRLVVKLIENVSREE